MPRVKMVAGNWKMNMDYSSGIKLAKAIRATAPSSAGRKVVIAPPSILLKSVADILVDSSFVYCAAQNCHQKDSGAFTGEISIPMIKSINVDYVIIGHSERREYFNEDAVILKEKVDAALSHGVYPIFCCGESLAVRQSGSQNEYVACQIRQSLFHLSKEAFSKIVLAYEPIWAIGTGETASPEQAQEMHAYLRKLIADKYDDVTADNCTILYGGSVKPGNAKEIFGKPDVDGGLVGGASLKEQDFCEIVAAM